MCFNHSHVINIIDSAGFSSKASRIAYILYMDNLYDLFHARDEYKTKLKRAERIPTQSLTPFFLLLLPSVVLPFRPVSVK